MSAKLPIDEAEAEAVQRLGKWMRVVGTIQLAIAGMALLFLAMQLACGAMLMRAGGVTVLLATVIPVVVVATFLLQALRIQAAGEQFKNLADEREVDYLELAFVRLKTVFVIDVVVAALLAVQTLGAAL